MSAWTLIPGAICVLGGLFFLCVAGVGILRLPDVYCRAHALGKALTLGVILLLIGYGLSVEGVAWWKIGVAVVFQLVSTPVASHLLCLIGYRRGVPRWSAGGWTTDAPRE
jgi:multicomponent Na+:H+ antiporter subunit G